MALLGEGGRLKLKRESPEPSTVTPADRSGNNSYQLNDTAIWSGDQVTLTAPGGVPLIVSGTQTGNPGGHGIWDNNPWTYAIGYENITPTDPFWDEAPAFPWLDQVPAVPSQTVYVHVDQFGRLSFYDNWVDAVNGDPALALPVGSVDFGVLTITSVDADWTYSCDIREWTLELDAPSVDTTGIGGRFGEAVKSLVSGGGEIGYMAELRNEEGENDPTTLMRLLLLTERGCKAAAQFWVMQGRQSRCADGLAPGDLYYECDLLVVGTSLNLVPTDVVGGAARFVTTGEIKLKLGV